MPEISTIFINDEHYLGQRNALSLKGCFFAVFVAFLLRLNSSGSYVQRLSHDCENGRKFFAAIHAALMQPTSGDECYEVLVVLSSRSLVDKEEVDEPPNATGSAGEQFADALTYVANIKAVNAKCAGEDGEEQCHEGVFQCEISQCVALFFVKRFAA